MNKNLGGWITWNGVGLLPNMEKVSEVMFRDGDTGDFYSNDNIRWDHNGGAGDIVAFRYSQPSSDGVSEADEEAAIQEHYERLNNGHEDMVNQPPHYQSDNGIECIDAIRAALGKEGFIAYCRGNVIKYSWRIKSNPAEDQGKAAWYANKAREALEE